MKLYGFPERLSNFTNGRRLQPYTWGTNDCVTFPADAVWAITGEDPIAEIRGTWTDEASAMALLESLGGLIKAVTARFPKVQREMAERGDLVAFKVAGQLSLAVCVGAHGAAPGPEGMLLTPMNEARLAWRV